MITVNCRDIPSLKSPLAVYTSEQVGAVPALKIREFVLDSINNDDVDASRVIKAIRNFLDSLSIEKHFAIIQNKNLISVVAIDDFKLEIQPAQPTDQFFSCVHCGHVTQFEAVHNNHMKIHYL
ncbi:C2H2-type zinc finger protein [Candidatus Nitrosotalea okcheonensis]|uniref:Zinc finger, C2H2 type n=1 Tax=Candidatus Nitrosotalea okcheonensis TaxID=1903276 RepID=A0A2H1FCZ2_9ARCH|nr:C2H2-type zinc finger protein [Candidatus Nitrosotalea okcheonensis]MDE1831022.1 C2H2-type zinc finger protein [Nitrososphaerota archaeon]MDE1840661.1 C2H2-type zinc finger protein [Nitrososphaerota archaeon]SMH70634.1 Zinc finger, C2H2 type [Candidatus Nitrosotalea okcheonensis]